MILVDKDIKGYVHNILRWIAEKNSRMRQGLAVSGPHYQLGHKTYAFLRVTNICLYHAGKVCGM